MTDVLISPFIENIEYWSDMRKATYAKNLKSFCDELEQENPQNITTAPPEIAVPIMERMSYTENERLANMFITLLKHASTYNDVGKVHPAFIHIIDRLSADEAKILAELPDNGKLSSGALYIINIIATTRKVLEDENREIPVLNAVDRWVLNDQLVNFDIPNAKHLYLVNLKSLGLIEPSNPLITKLRYAKTGMNDALSEVRLMFPDAVSVEVDKHRPYQAFSLSALGSHLISACLK